MEQRKKRKAVPFVSDQLPVGSDTKWKPERKCCGALERETHLVLVHSAPFRRTLTEAAWEILMTELELRLALNGKAT